MVFFFSCLLWMPFALFAFCVDHNVCGIVIGRSFHVCLSAKLPPSQMSITMSFLTR